MATARLDLMSFDDLFDRESVTRDQMTGQTYELDGPIEIEDITARRRKKKIRHRVTGFITERNGVGAQRPDRHGSFYARPLPGLVNMVANRLLALDRDRIYFEAIHHADGIALYGKNNLILNSGPPLCNIDPATWPSDAESDD